MALNGPSNTPWDQSDIHESGNNSLKLLREQASIYARTALVVLALFTWVPKNASGAELPEWTQTYQIDWERKAELEKQLAVLELESEKRQIAFLDELLSHAKYENHPKWKEWDKDKQERLKEYVKRNLIAWIGLVFFNPSDENQKNLFRYLVKNHFFNHEEAFWNQKNAEKIISSLFWEHGSFINTYSLLALELSAMNKIALHQADVEYAERQEARKNLAVRRKNLAEREENLVERQKNLAEARKSLAEARKSFEILKGLIEERQKGG